MTMAAKEHDALLAQLQQENQALQRELRKTKRELSSAISQIDRYKMSVQAKETLSQMISAEKERRELYLNNLLRVMPEIVLFMNADLEVVMCSESYLAAAGMTRYDEIIGKPGIPLDRLDYPDEQPPEQVRDALFQTMRNKELLEEEIYFTFVRGTPKKYYKKYTLPICDANDEPVGVILLFIDLSDIIEARERAQNASRAKGNFLANMSHEMRTPMNAIIGMTSIAQSAADLAKKDYCLGKISNASLHLLGVINDILDMSKIEANKMTVSQHPFDFEKMLMRVTGVVGFSLDEKDLALRVRLDEAIPPWLVSDDQRLSQVITNLLSNAMKFTPQGGAITLAADLLGEEGNDCVLRFAVTDTGIGISDEQKARLFHSFEQADVSTSRKYGGTGLGLAISKKIVEMLGGTIHVESELGHGASFIFTIRAKRGEMETPASADILRGLRVLAVDTSADVRGRYVRLAQKHGFACDAVSGLDEAKALMDQAAGYDIAFVECQSVDDLAPAQRLRQHSGARLVLITTGKVREALEPQARADGIAHFLSKPLFPSAILDLMHELCDPQAKEDTAQANAFNFTGKRMLLAEDVEINREILITVLESTGIEIESAENGLEAVDMFRQSPDRYDIIFMDIHMPEKDGYEATRDIRSLPVPWAKDIPIIAMTANVFREDVEACLQAGMNDHLGKPLDFKAVETKLAQYLSA